MGVTDRVKSPTYSLVEIYELAKITVLHMDLYRLKNPDEIEALSIRDYLSHKAILLIEWPENAEQKLPHPDVRCQFRFSSKGREITLKACTVRGEEMLENMVKMA